MRVSILGDGLEDEALLGELVLDKPLRTDFAITQLLHYFVLFDSL